jgi:hypothetical protein
MADLDTSEKIEYWFRFRHANMAVIAPAGSVILDFDNVSVYTHFCEASPEASCSYTERTPRGGAHVFVNIAEEAQIETVEGLEVKRIALVYPSKVQGKPYSVAGGRIVKVRLEEALQGFGTVKHTPSPTKQGPGPSHGQNGGDSGVIDKIKDDWPIREYLAFFEPALKLSGSGRWLAGLCPYHADRRPSLWVDTKRNLWGCHGCKEHGDVVNWHALRKGLTIKDAIRDLVKWSELVRVHV